MTVRFHRAELERVVTAIADRLEGEWLLIGGALVALWLEDERVTEDVDVVGIGGLPGERLALLELASDLGLPIESVNSAADYFVFRIPGWRDEIEPFRRGLRSVVYRPTPTLFVQLKLGRLSPRDLDDCRLAVARARAEGLRLDSARLCAALDARPGTDDAELAARRDSLRRLLLEG